MGVKSHLIATLVVLCCVSSLAQSTQPDSEKDLSGQVQMEVVKTSLQSYSVNKLVLGLTLSISSKRDLTLEQIVLTGLRINGFPLYAAPLTQRLQVHAGDKTLLPDPLPVTIYLHDLASIAPLERAVADGHMTLDGTAYATVKVNPFAAMLLFSRHVQVAINLHEEMLPFSIPGGVTGKAASLVALHAADKALRELSAKVNSSIDQSSAFRRDTMKQFAPHLLMAYASFELRDAEDEVTTVEWHGVAVTAAPDLVLVPREAIEPWKFDPQIVDAIHSKRLSLNSASYDLWLWPSSASVHKPDGLNADTAMRFTRKQFSVVRMPDGNQRTVMVLQDSGKTQKVSVARRDSSSDLVLLRVAKANGAFDALPASDSSSATEWDSVAIFRFRDGLRGSSADPELIVVPAKRDGSRITLGELVDGSAFGSPIVAPEGVIGIVQDEGSGVAWPEAARVLKLDKK